MVRDGLPFCVVELAALPVLAWQCRHQAAGVAFDVAQGERYSANPGFTGIFNYFSHLSFVRATGPVSCRCTNTASNDVLCSPVRVVGCRTQRVFDIRPGRERTVRRERKNTNPRVRRVRLTLGYIRRRSAATCRHCHARTGRRPILNGTSCNATRQAFANHHWIIRSSSLIRHSIFVTRPSHR